jgi:hypothetical protein
MDTYVKGEDFTLPHAFGYCGKSNFSQSAGVTPLFLSCSCVRLTDELTFAFFFG